VQRGHAARHVQPLLDLAQRQVRLRGDECAQPLAILRQDLGLAPRVPVAVAKLAGLATLLQELLDHPHRHPEALGHFLPSAFLAVVRRHDALSQVQGDRLHCHNLDTSTQNGYSFIENALSRYGNYCDRSNTGGYSWQDKSYDDGHDKTAPVGSYRPNAWGLYDMHGNVWEWCLDWYAAQLSGDTVREPVGPSSGTIRVFRGGGWDNTTTSCRSAFRSRNEPGYRYYDRGFRLALSSVP